MAVKTAEGGFAVHIDPQEWFRLKRELDRFDPAITRALRKRIRNAGDIAAQAVRDSLGNKPPEGGADPAGFRLALAQATKVSVSFSKTAAGVKVRTSSSGLPIEQKPLLAAYNKKKMIRHPLFGDESQWFEQPGRPYFGTVIYKVMDKALAKEIRAALDEAVTAIGGRGK